MSEDITRPNFPDAEEIVTAAEVDQGLARLAAQLQTKIDNNDCILLGVLTGALFPLFRLTQMLSGDYRLDCCHATRYLGETAGGELHWLMEPRLAMSAATVIVVDDIYDAGITLNAVADHCRRQGAAEVLTAPLFVKDCERAPDMREPDFDSGLRVPDRYVFGCGMDFHEKWRHLPSVYALNN